MTTDTQTPDNDRTVASAVVATAAVGVMGALVGLFVGGQPVGMSIAIGAGIAVVNLWFLNVVIRAVMGPGARPLPWSLLAMVKIGLLFGGFYALLQLESIEPLALFAGYGALPIGIVIGQMVGRAGVTRSES